MNSTAALPKPLGKYPRFRRAGPFIFVSGISARLPDGTIDGAVHADGKVITDIAVQTRRVLENLRAVLQSAGATVEDCVDVTMYLTDSKDFDGYNAVYGDFFKSEGPARTTVIVRGLPHADMVVEAKVVAYIAESP